MITTAQHKEPQEHNIWPANVDGLAQPLEPIYRLYEYLHAHIKQVKADDKLVGRAWMKGWERAYRAKLKDPRAWDVHEKVIAAVDRLVEFEATVHDLTVEMIGWLEPTFCGDKC